MFFSFPSFLSPDPLFLALLGLLASYGPPPPGRGMCERRIGLRLRAVWRFACFLSCRIAHSACARSLSSCLRLGSSSRVLFFPAFRVGSRCLSSGPVLSSPPPSRVLRPVRSLLRLCFRSPPSHPSGSVASSSPACPSALSLAIAWRCRVIPSGCYLASPRRRRLSAVPSLRGSSRSSFRFASSSPVPIVGLLASLISVSCRFRVGLAITVLVRFRSVSPITQPCLS